MIPQIRSTGNLDDDIDLAAAVNDTIHSLDIVRGSGLSIQSIVKNKVVTVSGVVLSRIMKQAVLQAVRYIPGITHVIDCLYTDTDLSLTISQALASDPITAQMYDIKVTSYRGLITLVGTVTSTPMIQAVTDLTSQVPGVRMVINRLTLVKMTA